MSFSRVEPLQHEIGAHYRALRAIRTRKALERSALWADIAGEVRRVLDGVERGDQASVATPASRARKLRAVAWNIQRGARLDDLRRAVAAPPFADADLFLLSEVDIGLGLTRLLLRLLRPWNGCVPVRLDWFAGRHLTAVNPSVERPLAAAGGRPLSDHSAVVVDVAV